MNARIFIQRTLIFLLFFSLAESGRAQKNKTSQPNIIFILTDDLGYGDVGVFFQNERAKARDRSEPWMFTPNLDKMAADGAKLTQQYCAAPVCAPSRASILLGVSQGHANVRDNQFDKGLDDNHTIATVLRSAGYATAAFGKWGLQGGPKYSMSWPAHPLNRGFDYFFGYMRHVDGHEHYPKEGLYRGVKQVWRDRTEISASLDKCYTADLWTAAAKKWIVEHARGTQKDSPFFIYLAFDTPHAVLELPTQQYPSGGGLKGGVQWLDKPGQMINTATGKIDSWMHPDYANATYDDDGSASTAEKPWPDTYKRYATSVRRIDTCIGDLLQLLRDLKIDSNTLVVFTSDNGPSLESYLPENYVNNNPDFFNSFGPFDGVKRDCWEGGVRMPALAVWPDKIHPRTVVKNPTASYDWLPTFADAAGIPPPARTDGVSLLPSLTGTGKQEESLIYIEYFHGGVTPALGEFAPDRQNRRRKQMQVIRIGDYVGVRYDIQSQADDFEIYDVLKDPAQRSNLAGQEDMQAMQQRMKDRVLQVRRPDASAARPYDDALVPATGDVKAGNNGLKWKTFRGDFPWIPDVRDMKPDGSGHSAVLDVNVMDKDENGVALFEGYLRVPKDGEYSFYLTTDTGAMLRIHDALVIDEDFGYESGSERSATMHLKAGLHPIKVWYMATPGGKSFVDLQWAGPGIERQAIDSKFFTYSE